MSETERTPHVEFTDWIKMREQHTRDVAVQLDTIGHTDKRLQGIYFYMRDLFNEMSTLYGTMNSMYGFMKYSDNIAFFLMKDFLGMEDKATIEETEQKAKDFGQLYAMIAKLIKDKEAEDKEKEQYR